MKKLLPVLAVAAAMCAPAASALEFDDGMYHFVTIGESTDVMASINDYSKIINDVSEGGADIISTSPGWTGHVAFVDPIPEFVGSGDIEEWLSQPAKIVTLHPMTIMQNSLNGTFGQSGDISNVPPRAATIGPIDVMRAKERIEVHALATNNTFSSWQRMTSRLVTHGPVTPYVPSSMLQTKKTQVYISEELAAPFECWEKVGY